MIHPEPRKPIKPVSVGWPQAPDDKYPILHVQRPNGNFNLRRLDFKSFGSQVVYRDGSNDKNYITDSIVIAFVNGERYAQRPQKFTIPLSHRMIRLNFLTAVEKRETRTFGK